MLLSAAALIGSILSSPSSPTAEAADVPLGSPDPAVQPLNLDGVPPGPHEITLITGDKVILGEAGDSQSVRVEGAPRTSGAPVWFQTSSGPNGTYVLPSDAAPAIQAGMLDRELFNVEYLATNEYTDAATDRIPVLVTYPVTTRARATAAGLAGQVDKLPATTAPVGLRSINGAGAEVAKSAAGQFWHHLSTPLQGHKLGSRMPALGGNVAKVWLNRKVEVDLAESVPLVGAPDAWNAGLDGAGVTVAVLDTGIDATHPDVAGKIDGSKSFVSADAVDGNGHGTHVAATVAGSGAASDGTRKGVAPGARLLIGKVLDNGGSGSWESVIAGMEWAAAEQNADVVSMSLGGCCSDGTDPASLAVDNLTASTGALFVIAAGNSGRRESIGAPGAADSALTVAATDKQDGLAGFSSRGPRMENYALKPDIAAPGVAITAARAAGTRMGSPVDQHYTSANGTSMATPHVAGAAAILAQRHPDWQAAQLKAALMSTSHDVGHSVYEVGAGRLDVSRAARQQIVATTSNLDFGLIEKTADDEPQPRTKQVAYSNLSAQPVTLSLTVGLRAADGTEVAADTLTSDASLTVPAGGTASTSVTLAPADLARNEYTGTLVATDQATGVRVTTPIGLVVQPPRYSLKVRTIGPDGRPMTPINQETIDVSGPLGDRTGNVYLIGEGVTEMRVFPGPTTSGNWPAGSTTTTA